MQAHSGTRLHIEVLSAVDVDLPPTPLVPCTQTNNVHRLHIMSCNVQAILGLNLDATSACALNGTRQGLDEGLCSYGTTLVQSPPCTPAR